MKTNYPSTALPFLGLLGDYPFLSYAPSWDKGNQHRLSKEDAITVLNHDAKWGRETFCRRRPTLDEHIFAYSTDSRGRIVRLWESRPHDTDCFDESGHLIPIEAVILKFLAPGLPGLTAHLFTRSDYPELEKKIQAVWEGVSR
jgi:hypothetical protein